MARPAGLEPATLGLEGRCSIQMSYGRMLVKRGRGREIRTPDILHPKQARYQTALYPVSKFFQTSKSACRSKEARIIRLMINYVKHILSFYDAIITLMIYAAI